MGKGGGKAAFLLGGMHCWVACTAGWHALLGGACTAGWGMHCWVARNAVSCIYMLHTNEGRSRTWGLPGSG